jgi:hypothetical protein
MGRSFRIATTFYVLHPIIFIIKFLCKYLNAQTCFLFSLFVSILEVEEENYSEKSEESSKFSTNTLTVRHVENALHFKYDLPTINRYNERRDSEFTYKIDIEQRDEERDSLMAFCPIEVCERNFLRTLQQQKEQKSVASTSSMYGRRENTTVSNCLQIPVITVPNVMEKPPPPPPSVNVYQSENMTIIDTDLPQVRNLFRLKFQLS